MEGVYTYFQLRMKRIPKQLKINLRALTLFPNPFKYYARKSHGKSNIHSPPPQNADRAFHSELQEQLDRYQDTVPSLYSALFIMAQPVCTRNRPDREMPVPDWLITSHVT